MVRNFKGVVKVADVQEEFDNLLNTINAKIDEYNSSLNIEDIDYNNGGPDLAPYGYTLSVGGLKSVLEAYDGAILGANVLRRSNGQYIVSEGLYILDGEVLRLPSKTVDGNGDAIYFNPITAEYTFSSERAGRLYPNSSGQVIFRPGTYPLIHVDSNYNKTYTTVTFNENQLVNNYVANVTSDDMQTSNCKFTAYASYSSQYDYSSLTPDCLINPDSPQYNDVYRSNLIGVLDSEKFWFTSEIPQDANLGSLWVYGLKAEFTFNELPFRAQSVGFTVKPGDNPYALYGWKVQIFAYDENDNLLTSSDIQVGTSISMFSTDNVPVNARKIVVCAVSDSISHNPVGNLYSKACELRITNLSNMTYLNTGVDCCLIYDERTSGYRVIFYSDYYNLLLGSAHFIENTYNDLEYVQLEDGGGVTDDNILISKVNSNRISRLCNRPNATNESIPDYKVTIESKNSGYVINGNQSLSNSDKGQFFSGSAGRNCRINLFDTQVAYHQWHGDRTDSYHEPFNFMFIPKGIPNPYNGLAGEIRFAMQKVWNYILHRPSR